MLPQEDAAKHMTSSLDLQREDSEHVRLVISANETRVNETDSLQSQTERSNWPLKWWIKVATWSIFGIIITMIFLKWGVPFIFEKVYLCSCFMMLFIVLSCFTFLLIL